MPMQQTACFSIHSVHTEPEVPTLVHAHARPLPMTRHCAIKKKKRKTIYSEKTGNLGIEKTRSHYFYESNCPQVRALH